MFAIARFGGIEAHRKVALLSAGLLATMGLVVAVGVVGLHRIQAGDGAELDTEVGGLQLILMTDRDLYQAQLALEQGTGSSDRARLETLLNDYRQNVRESDSRYARFAQLAAHSDNEKALRSAYFSAQAQWIEATSRFIDSNRAPAEGAGRPALLEEARTSFRRAHEGLDQLETLYDDLIAGSFAGTAANAHHTENTLLASLGAALAGGLFVTRSCVRAIRAQQDAIKMRNAQRETETARREFESRLGHGMEMAQTEESARGLVEEVLAEVAPGAPAETLLADSSKAHLHRVATTQPKESDRLCDVVKPYDCPAVRRGQSVRFNTSESFDTCPRLKGRPSGPCSALCVPLSIMGKTVGVLHTTGPDRLPPGDELAATLVQIASKAGDRIGVLRAFRKSESQASIDPLTGLLNRRSFEEQVRDLVKSGSRFAVAYGDLDHFKRLNDTHGHDTGDRSLRLFSRTLRETIRPGDVAARWGGEEFVLLLPDASASDGAEVLERIRKNLAMAQQAGKIPPFTVSFGIGDNYDAAEFTDLLAMADGALLTAKRAGRDRVVLVGHEPSSGQATRAA